MTRFLCFSSALRRLSLVSVTLVSSACGSAEDGTDLGQEVGAAGGGPMTGSGSAVGSGSATGSGSASGGTGIGTGGTGTGGRDGSSGTVPEGTGGMPIQPVDCSGITNAGFDLCTSSATTCEAQFDDSTGCTAVCAAAGLGCARALENVDERCAADSTLPELSCETGHQSDYCICEGTLAFGTGGGAGTGGAAGSGGAPASGGAPGSGGSGAGGSDGDNLPKVSGFASTASNGLSTTTGGGNASVEMVTSCADLKSKLEDGTARVLEIPSGTTLDCRSTTVTRSVCKLQCEKGDWGNTFFRVPVGDQTCNSLADFDGNGTLDVDPGIAQQKTLSNFQINVESNKTLRGAGSGATIKGVNFNLENVSNIILQNVAITEINADTIEAGDGLTVNSSHHVWVDHCEFSMISDGYADIRYDSDSITLSYNYIDGRSPASCSGQHNFISLVTDSNVTYHHNYFDHVGGRNPKVSGDSDVHVFNNFYNATTYFCANSGAGSEVLVENNHYLDSRYPHWVDGGSIEASGNQYSGSTSTSGRDSNANVFDPPYSYNAESATGLNTSVPAASGIGKY